MKDTNTNLKKIVWCIILVCRSTKMNVHDAAAPPKPKHGDLGRSNSNASFLLKQFGKVMSFKKAETPSAEELARLADPMYTKTGRVNVDYLDELLVCICMMCVYMYDVCVCFVQVK